jgi:transcription initiation factor TFIIIB Brf1 subunit/transcription initiation factor TFIIB
MGAINFFETIEYLEPRCPNCQCVLDYGVNTKYSNKEKTHVCLACGAVLK